MNRGIRTLPWLLCATLLLCALALPAAALSPTAPTPTLGYATDPSELLASPCAELFYAQVSQWVEQIADGEISSTVFFADLFALRDAGLRTEWRATAGETPLDPDAVNAAFWEQLELDRVLELLRHDHPYSMYWYDKTAGGGVTYGCSFTADDKNAPTVIDVTVAKITFSVSADYRDAAYDPSAPTVSEAGVARARAARAAADAIVERYAGRSPLELMKAYRDEIHALVSYDTAAANGGRAYGDPWQMIYVFDGDSSTNVVCEGYAKAFEYLCDVSGLHVRSASGLMDGENHMWNLATMEDGRNYLIDLTNCDDGMIGEGGALFLSGADGSVGDGYVLDVDGTRVTYVYDADTRLIHSDALLTLSDTSYTGAFGVGFSEPITLFYDGLPVKAFSRTQTAMGDPAWLAYQKQAIIYFGDGTFDESAELNASWYARNADGTRGEALGTDPTEAGEYLLVVKRKSDGREFTSPTLTVLPLPVSVSGVSAEDRVFDGTPAISAHSATLEANGVSLPAHLTLDLSAAGLVLPHADAGEYSSLRVTGTLQFTTEERNYVLSPVLSLPLTDPVTVSKAPAPTVAPLFPELKLSPFVFDTSAWIGEAFPADAGDAIVSMDNARKWGRVEVTDVRMDAYGRISAHFSNPHGGDRLEMTLTVTTQNYEDVTVELIATAPCIYAPAHDFSAYVSDGNATCLADGTKTATCVGCRETSTLPDVGSRTPHRYEDGACADCGAADPTPPPTEESGQATSAPNENGGTEARDPEATDTPLENGKDAPADAVPWIPITVAVGAILIVLCVLIIVIKRRR